MNGIQDKKAQSIEKQFPGCLGRMVNLFDLTSGVNGNRLLTDKPHRDVSSLSRSRSDVARMMSSPFGDQIEDKMIVSELKRSSSNKKSNGTPIKTLIAREMSKEVDSRHNPPNVVAKLMGLDTLPHQQSNSAAERSHSRGYSRRSLSHSGILVECWEQDHSLDEKIQRVGHHHEESNEYRDVYEIWQQSQTTDVRDSSLHKGRHHENANERKMTLVRQKFMEAKRLATDEKGRQSKEFQDALEVLSSNRDIFLKFLQEPNSMFSPHLYDVQSTPSPETKRITVLRPSNVMDIEKFSGPGKKGDKQFKRAAPTGQSTVREKNNSGCSPIYANQKFEEYPAQPTRIVVLKPSSGKTHDVKTVVSPPLSPPRTLQGEDFYVPEDDEAQESREVAKGTTHPMDETSMGHRRDETLLSSVFSNGYIGDDSSFNKSENEYAVGNLSDSEIMSPTSRHSWEYLNRFGSPYSSSSFSRASCSPESSVCREAKKRLSERWAMMASTGSSQEQKNARRSSSTLGEMLALSDTKKLAKSEVDVTNKEQESRESSSCLSNNLDKEEGVSNSPKSLLRSRSVPVSVTVYDTGLSVDVSNSEVGKSEISKELRKAKSTKSSFKWKVSSLFFSSNKRSSKEKDCVSQSNDESQSATPETPGSPMPSSPGKIGNDASQCANSSGLDNCLSPGLRGSSSKTTFPDLIGTARKQGLVFQEDALSVAKPGNMGENQDQPSPVSVLEPNFDEDDNTAAESSGNFRLNCRGAEVPLKSNLIDKSPPIESIARTLSWDDSYAETATSFSLRPSSMSICPEEEEQDWPFFIQTLLSAAGLDGNTQLDSFSSRWHSPESPIDPALRNKYANLNDKELLHEARRRQRRSNRKLVFDCVNAALAEITRCGFDRSAMVVPGLIQEGTPSSMVVEHVWGQMKEWFGKLSYEESGDRSSLVVERVVRKEVVGKGWVENMRMELDKLGVEIEEKLLAELVEDAVVDLTS
ncbi:uncharacterized protein LOC126655200 [Mercurialis annua]|uniref:uncharacterized protein LOC126655200 n=1 Tax=Mercurialis annua TaxID=3986 RepID=UPI00215E2B8D|nr:uncharacterized protein LOC126655200 [Mercurialis annua]XP_050205200.1 uncharacterized protein LOC126655200 [Mercurialis annua]